MKSQTPLLLSPMELSLLARSNVSAAVVGAGDTFELFSLNEDGASQFAKDAMKRGLNYLGIVALTRDGQVDIAYEPGANAALMIRACTEFAMRVLTAMQSDVQWLEKLYRLPDTRA